MVFGSIDEYQSKTNRPRPSSNKGWRAKLKINYSFVSFKLDTGAQSNVLPLKIFNNLFNKSKPILKFDSKLTTYSGETLPVIGKCVLRVQYGDGFKVLEFHVVDINATPILGLQSCTDFNLIQRV